MEKKFDVVCVGHALMDIQQHVDDNRLRDLSLTKGAMRLVEEAEASFFMAAMPQPALTPGGSGANSMAVVASLGGRAGFMCRLGGDDVGAVYRNRMQAEGVTFSAGVLDTVQPTGRCLIFTTPDGQRTMNTMLGANKSFSCPDLDFNMIAASRILLVEGYMCDAPTARDAFEQAINHAHKNKTLVAFTLSSASCVARNRDYFRKVVLPQTDILFGNEEELQSLYYEAPDYLHARAQLKGDCRLAFITRGAQGAEILGPGRHMNIKPVPGVKVVDTTGAGDAFAGGVLQVLAQEGSSVRAARMGCLAASEVISHDGARPLQPLKAYVERMAQTTSSVRAKCRIPA